MRLILQTVSPWWPAAKISSQSCCFPLAVPFPLSSLESFLYIHGSRVNQEFEKKTMWILGFPFWVLSFLRHPFYFLIYLTSVSKSVFLLWVLYSCLCHMTGKRLEERLYKCDHTQYDSLLLRVDFPLVSACFWLLYQAFKYLFSYFIEGS